MKQLVNNVRQYHLLSYITAALCSIPIGAVAWFELAYLWFGLTGKDPMPAINTAAFLIAFGFAFGWPLYKAHRPLKVVQRSCRLGLVVAMLLPAVAIAVLLLWQNASGRPDLGMGGLMLYNLPFIGLGVAIVLVILFAIGNQTATQRMKKEADQS